jgi:hypothetical protein
LEAPSGTESMLFFLNPDHYVQLLASSQLQFSYIGYEILLALSLWCNCMTIVVNDSKQMGLTAMVIML